MSSVLTISSHVIHGYVGGKAIIFPLQSLGWNVDNINTVNYSNHTGYGAFKGTQITVSEFHDLLQNILRLEASKSYRPEFIISGYFPNGVLIEEFRNFLVDYKQSTQNKVVYLLDPILGDQNQLYVDQSCIGQYQQLLSTDLVDIITPNQFELQLLTGITLPISNHRSLIQAIHKLKDQAPNLKFIVVTSFVIENNPNDLFCVFTTKSTHKIYYYKISLLKGYFVGVGDLFTGLLIDKLNKNFYNLEPEARDEVQGLSKSINQVLWIMTQVLSNTYRKGFNKLGRDIERMGDLEIGAFELDLIDSIDIFKSKLQQYELKELEDCI